MSAPISPAPSSPSTIPIPPSPPTAPSVWDENASPPPQSPINGPLSPVSAVNYPSQRAVITLSDGSTYIGHTENSMWHGTGRHTQPNGSYYEGGWNQGRKEGAGEEFIQGIGIYRGTWVNDLKHGNFTFTNASNGLVFHLVYENGVEKTSCCDSCVIL